MGLKKFLLASVLAIALLSCGEAEKLGNVNLENFKSDRNGCKNLRQIEIDNLMAVQDSLLGMSENEIFNTLGRYDMQILDRRQKKVFIYCLENGEHCQYEDAFPTVRTLALRFNAVSLVNEVSIQVGLP